MICSEEWPISIVVYFTVITWIAGRAVRSGGSDSNFP
jgi:hypothetical protein